MKFALSGESPQDYAGFLRSLRYPPSISISNIPNCLASHVNNSIPNNGRWLSVTEDNIAAAEQGILKK